MLQLTQVIQKNAAGAEELASSADMLKDEAEQLEEIIKFFILDEEQSLLMSETV